MADTLCKLRTTRARGHSQIKRPDRKVRSPRQKHAQQQRHKHRQQYETNREYVVEAIIGERGVIAHKTKEYKVKWQDYSEDHGSTHSNRQEMSALARLQEAQERPSSQRGKHSNTSSRFTAIPADTMMQQICKEAGVSEADVLFVYAGVPCETYSIAGRTNKERDLHKTGMGTTSGYTDAERNPCCPEQDEMPICRQGTPP